MDKWRICNVLLMIHISGSLSQAAFTISAYGLGGDKVGRRVDDIYQKDDQSKRDVQTTEFDKARPYIDLLSGSELYALLERIKKRGKNKKLKKIP